jgi:hypothetical protein
MCPEVLNERTFIEVKAVVQSGGRLRHPAQLQP